MVHEGGFAYNKGHFTGPSGNEHQNRPQKFRRRRYRRRYSSRNW